MPTAWDNIKSPDNIPNNIPKIAISIPYNGKWDPEWVEKTYRHLRCIPVNWCTKLIFYSKAPSLPVSRDSLVNQALQNNCSHIFFVDSDLIFEKPEDPNKALGILYQVINKDPNSKEGKIVSGLYRAKQKEGFNWAAWMKFQDKGFVPIQEWTGNWIKIDVTGLGCCLIDTVVFKNIPKPYFYWEIQGDISEDFYFYQLATKFGYDTHVFTDVRLSHLGNLKVKSDGSIIITDM